MNASGARLTWQHVWTQTILRFRAQFQYYFPPILLTGAVAYSCIYGLQLAHDKLPVRPSYESVMNPDRSAIPPFLYAIARFSIWPIQLWVVWLAFTFVLATFAVKMLHDRQAAEKPMRIGEAFRLVRARRLGSLIGISALAAAATGLFRIVLIPVLLRPLELSLVRFYRFIDYFIILEWTRTAFLLIFTALLTKMALAIPELVDDADASIGGSIRNSFKATARWELFFVLMFAIAGLAGKILYAVGSVFLNETARNSQLSSAGHGMLLAAFTVVLAALATTLLAITYSVLYVGLRYGRVGTIPDSEAAEASG